MCWCFGDRALCRQREGVVGGGGAIQAEWCFNYLNWNDNTQLLKWYKLIGLHPQSSASTEHFFLEQGTFRLSLVSDSISPSLREESGEGLFIQEHLSKTSCTVITFAAQLNWQNILMSAAIVLTVGQNKTCSWIECKSACYLRSELAQWGPRGKENP